jgi:hypothetical protein
MDTPAQPPHEKRRLNAWPLLFCVLPVLIAFLLIALINRPVSNAGNEPKPSSGSAADLGSRGLPVAAPNHNKSPAVETENTQPGNSAPTEEPGAPATPGASEREIEIHIKNLKFAVQHNNAKGRELEASWLRNAKPPELVAKMLLAALEVESDAAVRLAFYDCLPTAELRETWALRTYDKTPGKFLGTDENYAQGEIAELSVYLNVIGRGQTREQDRVGLVRAILQARKPRWALEVLGANIVDFRPCVYDADIEEFLRSAGAELGVREQFVHEWARRFKSQDELIAAMGAPEFVQYWPALLKLLSDEWKDTYIRSASVKILEAVKAAIAACSDTALKSRIIETLGGCPFDATKLRDAIQAGMNVQGPNRADYIVVWGRIAATRDELKRLTDVAGGADSDTARAAVNGLRQSRLKAADDELKDVLLHGANSGVKGDALAALLERNSQTRDALVDEYLAEDKPASLRVISVSYLADNRLERLKELGESDPEMRVREAAINKLGSLKDKSLKTWFTRVSRSDPVPVLRQLAKKYAAELE